MTFVRRLEGAASSKCLPVTPAPGRPSYSKVFTRTKDGGNVQSVDMQVSSKDEEFFIDFLVTAPHDTN